VKIIFNVLIACLIFAVTVAAGLQFAVPWRMTDDWVATFSLIPLAFMIIVLLRAPETAVPSWLAFGCGIVMDTLSHGVLGYWALTYTACTPLARLVSSELNAGLINRICLHAAMAAFVFMLHVLLHISLNWNGLLGELAWTGIGHSTMRMFIFAASVEVMFAVLANLSFQLEGFGSLALPSNTKPQ